MLVPIGSHDARTNDLRLYKEEVKKMWKGKESRLNIMIKNLQRYSYKLVRGLYTN